MTRLRTVQRRLQPLLRNRTGSVIVLMLVSVLAGVAEAGVLAIVAVLAAALVNGVDHLSLDLGPISVSVGIASALWLAGALAVLRVVMQIAMAWLPSQISADAQATMQADLFSGFSSTSWATQAAEVEGQLQELMTSYILRATEAVNYVALGLSAGLMFAALVGAAFVLSVPVAIAVLLSAAGMLILLHPINKVGRVAAGRMAEAQMNYAAGVSEAARFAEEAQVFGTGVEHRRRVEHLISETKRPFFRFMFTYRLAHSSYQSVIILMVVAGLAGLYAFDSSGLPVLGAAILILVRAASYGQQIQGSHHALNLLVPYIARLEEVLAHYRHAQPVDEGRALPEVRSLAMRNVNFFYRPDQPVLRGLSFAVSAGEAIGIVGPSGSGKSTLVQLLLRLREPTEGDFLVNDERANLFARSDWRQRVAYVGQDPQVFHGSVADNIRYFRDLDDASVERAAQLAHIHEDIMAMPACYDTLIGQRADAVSGGQRQRICLARALAAKPDLLVLDEPTSALDLASEAAVAASLAELHGRMTLFIVAHRLSTISTCDRILVIADGNVAAFGTTAELTLSNDFFRRATLLTDAASS